MKPKCVIWDGSDGCCFCWGVCVCMRLFIYIFILLKFMGGAGGIVLFHSCSLCCLYLFGLDMSCQLAAYICIFSV
jgi:hypothetical protein